MKTKLHLIKEPDYKDSVCGAKWDRGEDRDFILWQIQNGQEVGKNVCLNCLNKLGISYKHRY